MEDSDRTTEGVRPSILISTRFESTHPKSTLQKYSTFKVLYKTPTFKSTTTPKALGSNGGWAYLRGSHRKGRTRVYRSSERVPLSRCRYGQGLPRRHPSTRPRRGRGPPPPLRSPDPEKKGQSRVFPVTDEVRPLRVGGWDEKGTQTLRIETVVGASVVPEPRSRARRPGRSRERDEEDSMSCQFQVEPKTLNDPDLFLLTDSNLLKSMYL